MPKKEYFLSRRHNFKGLSNCFRWAQQKATIENEYPCKIQNH